NAQTELRATSIMQPTRRWPHFGKSADYESQISSARTARYRKYLSIHWEAESAGGNRDRCPHLLCCRPTRIVAVYGTCCPVPGTYEWVVVGLPYVIVYEINEAAHEIAMIAV